MLPETWHTLDADADTVAHSLLRGSQHAASARTEFQHIFAGLQGGHVQHYVAIYLPSRRNPVVETDGMLVGIANLGYPSPGRHIDGSWESVSYDGRKG